MRIVVAGICFSGCCSIAAVLRANDVQESAETESAAIDFNSQIRPILSDRCFHCHGPDSRNQSSDLRLDTDENAFADLGGYAALVPNDLANSELHRRIHSNDSDEVMPPPDSNRSLSPQEIATLDEWIRQGAKFDRHWSLNAPTRPPVPKVSNDGWPTNPIDSFVLHQLERKNLSPSAAADRSTLLRRVTLDLTGLPPTLGEVDAFLADDTEHAYERVVDRLLASPKYGERMALPWLDAARYADSAGYQNDFKRTQWPWRDWVIRAFNANMPFDQFSIEQLAGDLLPNPTPDQLLATAFNRNHRINAEGGIIPQEFLVEYVADRVETTSTVWLGMTIGCARCHDHKYDPVSQKDFYRLFAFFHNIDEKGKDGDAAPQPNIPVYTGQSRDQHERLKANLVATEKTLRRLAVQNKPALTKWIDQAKESAESIDRYASVPKADSYYPLDFSSDQSIPNLGLRTRHGANATAKFFGERGRARINVSGLYGNAVAFSRLSYLNLGRPHFDGGWSPDQPGTWALWVKIGNIVNSVEGVLLSCMTPDESRQGYQVKLVDPGDELPYRVAVRCYSDREKCLGIEVVSEPVVPRNQFTHVAVTYDGSGKAEGVTVFVNGASVVANIENNSLDSNFNIDQALLLGAETESSVERGVRDELLAAATIDDIDVYSQQLNADQVHTLFTCTPTELLATHHERSKAVEQFLSQTYSETHDQEYQIQQRRLRALKAQLDKFEDANITYVSVMKEMSSPRETHLLVRGAYDAPDLSQPLTPATPEAVLPWDDRLPSNRLGLAKWLFDAKNPLVARVAVNRFWQNYFGAGIVKTSEDFGSQGEPPSHPQLLDWLAVEFRESGWDVKAIQKLIVMSSTYRQSSVVSPKLLRLDPENRLLARGPRFRLGAHAIRDQALAASGLLSDREGGPPVMPYQPAGLWDEVSAKGYKYIVGDRGQVHRRSVYTFWRRTVPPPSMMNFDTAAREICSVSISRTNTPLQAMNLLNDPTYVEAARALAQRMLAEGGDDIDDQIRYGMKRLLSRDPSPAVLRILKRGHSRYLEKFSGDIDAAKSLVTIGKSPVDEAVDVIRLASLTAVASVMLNLDATVTKQ
tara:strand:+ start:42034 stop:45312 length:3279 start_codon:yes stop_codon:yes gene_type:complete